MDIRRLEVFVTLMQTRSFSKTGQELGLTQPTISGHIKTLEQQIALKLFDRHRRQVKPTAAALVLLDYAKRILEIKDEAGYALENFKDRVSGRLSLGGSTIPGGYILPAIMGRFHQIYRETYLSLVLGDTSGIVRLVAEGDLEIGLVGARLENEEVSFEPAFEDQMVLAVPADHPWAKSGRPVSVKALAGEPFVIREEGSGTRSVMLAALAAHGITLQDLNLAAEMGGTEAVRQAVKAGLGVSIISRVAVEDTLDSGQVKTVPVRGLNLSRRFFIVSNNNRTRSPLCSAFLEFLRKEGRASSMT